MKLLSIISALVAIQSWQFLSPTFAMDGAGPSGSGEGTKQGAWWESIEASLRAMNSDDAEVQRVIALIDAQPLYREFLIKGNKEAKNMYGFTPLHSAARNRHLEIASLLLDRGAHVDARDASRNTPLHTAAYRGHLEVVRLLLDRGANVEARDDDLGRNPLHEAAFHGHLEIVRLLLARGANVEARDNENQSPFDLALRNLMEARVKIVAGGRKTLDLLTHMTAFQQRDAAALMAYMNEGRYIDLDLMKARLGHTEYQEAQSLEFLEALRVQAGLQTTLGASEVKVLIDGQEQNVSVEEAKAKVIELVRSWIVHQQELQAFHAFQQGEGEALRAHLEQGKAVDLELLRTDLQERPYHQQRLWLLRNALQQGSLQANEVAQNVIVLIDGQLSLKNMSFQVLRENIEEQELLSAKTADEWIDKYMNLGKK